MSECVYAVKRFAFRPDADAVNEFLQGCESELDVLVAQMMLCALLAPSLCLVVAVARAKQRWVVLYPRAFRWVVFAFKPRLIPAGLAEEKTTLAFCFANYITPRFARLIAPWADHGQAEIEVGHRLLLRTAEA